eukprot:4988262-Prymnesium_polylepis.1
MTRHPCPPFHAGASAQDDPAVGPRRQVRGTFAVTRTACPRIVLPPSLSTRGPHPFSSANSNAAAVLCSCSS